MGALWPADKVFLMSPLGACGWRQFLQQPLGGARGRNSVCRRVCQLARERGVGNFQVLPRGQRGRRAGLAVEPQPGCHVLSSAHDTSERAHCSDLQASLIQSFAHLAVYLLGLMQGPSLRGSVPDTPLTPKTFPAGLGHLGDLVSAPLSPGRRLACLACSRGGSRQHAETGGCAQ